MREKQFEEKVKRWLESVGIYRLGHSFEPIPPVKPVGYYLKRWGGSKYVPAGVPDMQIVIGCFNLDVELKNETGKLDPLQAQKLKQIRNSGGYAMVLRPKDFDKFKSYIIALITQDERLTAMGEIWKGCAIGASEF